MPKRESFALRSKQSRARRDSWVDARLLDTFMQNSYTGTPFRLSMVVGSAVLLLYEVPTWNVLLLVFVVMVSIAVRHGVYYWYERRRKILEDPLKQASFRSSVGWLWTWSGIAWPWGFTLCHTLVSPQLEAAFLLTMMAFVALAVERCSPWPTVIYGYTSVSLGGVMLVMLADGSHGYEVNGVDADGILILIIGICWVVMLMAGKRFHRILQGTYRLQYRNLQLTQSLKRKTEAALRAVALKNRLLAAASHDIRQPIHALTLYAQYLGEDPSQGEELAPRIVQASRAVNGLFDSLLSYAQIEAGGMSLRVQPVRVDELVQDLKIVYEPVAREKGLELRIRLPEQSVVVLSDSMQLRRILGNLLDNAIKYTHQGGVLLSVQERSNRRVRVSVVDTGQGIPQQYQKDVFGEFVTVPSLSNTVAADGVGLGLSIGSRLAHALGHKLQLRSNVGHGSVFCLWLDDELTRQARERSHEKKHGKKRSEEQAGTSGTGDDPAL